MTKQRRRAKTLQQREYVAANREKVRESSRAYDRTHRKERAEYQRKYRAKNALKVYKMNRRIRRENPAKYRAWIITSAAIARGKLLKKPCEVCACVLNVQAHHDDYNEPLAVRWLCKKHHAQRHVEMRSEML